MTKIAQIAAASFIFALTGPLWAQADKPAKEAAKPAPQEAAKASKPAPKKGSAAKRQEDARHCLEKASNTEIIKCAEAYL